MSNEELAVRVKNGDRELVPELWAQVEKFVKFKGNRLINKLPASCGVEFDDLVQSGFLAMMRAVEYYNPSHGTAFTTVLSLTLKTAFAETAGCRTSGQRYNPLNMPSTKSLDAPMCDDGENDAPLLEIVPDARDAFANAEKRIFNEQLHQALEEVLANLNFDQADIIRQRFYKNESLKRVADVRGCSTERARQIEGEALRRIRNPKHRRILEPFTLEMATPYFLKVGVKRFQTTMTSSVEELVFFRESMRARDAQGTGSAQGTL